MAAQTKRLSARFVDAVTTPGLHADGDGLYLNVSPKGAKRWVFIYFTGKRRELSLGSLAALPLAKAREAAAFARAQGDPIKAREEAEAQAKIEAAAAEAAPQRTFGVFAEELVKALAPGFRNAKHLDQWRMTLSIEREKDGGGWKDSGYCIALRPKPLEAIGTDDILGVLQPIWQAKPETASRVRGRIERVLDAGKAKGFRAGENPARWRGHLDALLPKRAKLSRGHHAAIPYAELPALMTKLREANGVGALALEFTILNAARSGEVIAAKRSEIDRSTNTWVIPKQRMKAGREHRVPLTKRGLEIVDAMAEISDSEFIFPGTRPRSHISNMTMAKALSTAGGADFTVHGMRSAFRDWCGEETGFPESLAEQALAHIVGDATERAYRRGDALAKRRKLMEAWATYCEPGTDKRVVQLKGARRA